MGISYQGRDIQKQSDVGLRLEKLPFVDYTNYDETTGLGAVQSEINWLVADNNLYSSSVEFDKESGEAYSASYFLPTIINVSGAFYGSLSGTATSASYVLSASYAPTDSSSLYNAAIFSNPYLILYKGDGSGTILDLSTLTVTSASHALTASYVNPLVQNVIITGSTYLTDSIYFSGSGAASRLVWNDTDGTLDLGLKGGNVTLQIGQEQVIRVVNKTGANLLESEYKAVRIRRVDEGGAQGQRLAIVLAQANNDANSVDTLGLVTENIDNNQEGFITNSGLVRGIDTTGTLQGETWVDGDPLYLSPTTAGAITKVKPQAPQHTVNIGYVVYAHVNNGKIFVKVDNGYEIDELHNVRINTGSLTSGDLLVYSSSVWINTKQLTGSYGLTGSLTATSFTGSLLGTASYATQALSASWAPSVASNPFPFTGSAIISGSLVITGSFEVGVPGANNPRITSTGTLNRGDVVSVDWISRNLQDNSAILSVDWESRVLNDAPGGVSADWASRTLNDAAAAISIDWESRVLNDIAAAPSVDWEGRFLYDSTGAKVYSYETRDLVYPNNTSALNYGTQNQIGIIGSVLVTGSLVVSGSSTFRNIGPAQFTGSVNSQGGFTGSLQGTASFATTASFLLGSVTSASFASTASFVNPLRQTVQITGSLTVTGSVISNTDGLNRLARYGTALSGSTIGTGVTAQTIVFSQLIPANTFGANDVIRTYYRFRKLSTNANATHNIIVNTSNAVAGATTLATLTANTVHNQIKRDFYIAQGNATTSVGSGINTATDDTTNTQLLSTINWAVDQYLMYTVTLGTTDSGYGLGYTIEQVL